jgi:hypothetical protein
VAVEITNRRMPTSSARAVRCCGAVSPANGTAASGNEVNMANDVSRNDARAIDTMLMGFLEVQKTPVLVIAA